MTEDLKKRVAVVGATGAVGRVMLQVLEERDFPIESIRLFASARSAGKEICFRGQMLKVETIDGSRSFENVDFALFSAGGVTSRELAPIARNAGAIVIDNSNAWRMDPDVPLVVPEVNSQHLLKHSGIIANPNCSTIQLVVVLNVLESLAPIRRVVVSTYQSVSGTGLDAIDELQNQIKAAIEGSEAPAPRVYPHPIAFNLLPEIDVFDDEGNSMEEMKMVRETRKIMDRPDLMVSATCVRVPVRVGHGESVNVEFERAVDAVAAREALAAHPSIIVEDDPRNHVYPLPTRTQGLDPVFVGRIRKDVSHAKGLNMWIVADNLRKGAATNAIQIAEKLMEVNIR